MPRGRPKGSKNLNKSTSISVVPKVEEEMRRAVIKINNNMNNKPSRKKLNYSRDENGLLENVNYQFNEDGSVDWREMVKDEYLFPNKSWFDLRKKDVPRSIDGLKDHQLLIKLAGIKELAKLRGFSNVSYNVVKCDPDHVAVSCSISFIPNFETSGEPIHFEDMANATLNNTSSFATKFLETIACNRAFVRCVRNFLNIHIVGDDEIDKSSGSNQIKQMSKASLGPDSILKQHAEQSGVNSFDSFLNQVRVWYKQGLYKPDENNSPSGWNDYADIPAKEARVLIKLIKSL